MWLTVNFFIFHAILNCNLIQKDNHYYYNAVNVTQFNKLDRTQRKHKKLKLFYIKTIIKIKKSLKMWIFIPNTYRTYTEHIKYIYEYTCNIIYFLCTLSIRPILKEKIKKRNVNNVPKIKKKTPPPLTYNHSGVPGRNSSPGPISKEKERKGTLVTFQKQKKDSTPFNLQSFRYFRLKFKSRTRL